MKTTAYILIFLIPCGLYSQNSKSSLGIGIKAGLNK
jgi:hypothetical protein